MTLPASIRINTMLPFPTLVLGSGPISIAKLNGIWTVGFSFSQLGQQFPALLQYTTDFVLVYDSIAGTYFKVSLASIVAIATNSFRIVTAAGDVTVLINDQNILMNKTVGATTNILFPTAASRAGVPLTIKDYKGDANTNNITIVPFGAETIDGFSGAAAAINGTALIDTNYGKKTYFPLLSGGWYL